MQPHPLIHEELARQREHELRARPTTRSRARHDDSDDLGRAVRAAAAGDEKAWTLLVGRFTPTLRGIVRGYRLGAADVDDVVQSTWALALPAIAKLREPDAIGGWLCVIARREALRTIDRRRCEVSVDESALPEPEEHATAETAIVEHEESHAVHAAVGRLSGRQRTLVSLFLQDPGMSYAEVSTRLGLPIGSIGPTRERALGRLRRDRRLGAALSRPVGSASNEATGS
jgi:RNA polymerase sigma factor (sigma-70 family)